MHKLQHCNVLVVVISDVATRTNTRQTTVRMIFPQGRTTIHIIGCIHTFKRVNNHVTSVNCEFTLISHCKDNRLKEAKTRLNSSQVAWLCLWLFVFNDWTLLFGFYSYSFTVLSASLSLSLPWLWRGMRPSNFNSITHYKRENSAKEPRSKVLAAATGTALNFYYNDDMPSVRQSVVEAAPPADTPPYAHTPIRPNAHT